MSASVGENELQFASLGKKLSLAREARGLTIEQVAKTTRIRAQLLLHLEGDDFTHFSHPSYLRLYLMDYARFLGVPLNEIRDWLPDAGSPGSENYEYINSLGSHAAGQVKKEYFYPRHNARSNWQRTARVLLVCAVLGLGVAIYKLVQDLSRISGAGETPNANAEKVEPKVAVAAAVGSTDSFDRDDGEFLLSPANAAADAGTAATSPTRSLSEPPGESEASVSIIEQPGNLSLSNPPVTNSPAGAQIQ